MWRLLSSGRKFAEHDALRTCGQQRKKVVRAAHWRRRIAIGEPAKAQQRRCSLRRRRDQQHSARWSEAQERARGPARARLRLGLAKIGSTLPLREALGQCGA